MTDFLKITKWQFLIITLTAFHLFGLGTACGEHSEFQLEMFNERFEEKHKDSLILNVTYIEIIRRDAKMCPFFFIPIVKTQEKSN